MSNFTYKCTTNIDKNQESFSKNILFRADSSSKIGLGHIMRDLVLAKSYEREGANIMFACRDLEGNIMEKIPYKKIVLKSNSIEELQDVIEQNSIDMVVIDHYDIDYKFEKQLKTQNPKLKILSFDDTYEKHYCDILLNHNISADKTKYKDLVPSFCELRCGANYTLIRDEFKKEKAIKREKIYDYFIAMGGADTANLSETIMIALPVDKKICIVTSSANKNLEILKQAVEKRENVELFVDSDNIAKLLNQSRFSIITPSVMVHEVLFMGVDFLAIKTAENQEAICHYLKEHGYSVMDGYHDRLFLFLLKHKSYSLVDFTDMSQQQKEMVLSWRNDKNVAIWMLNQNIISLHEHEQFVKSLKSKKDRRYFLLYHEHQPIGVIDFTDIDMTSAEIGIYAKPALRGVGSIMMDILLAYAKEVLQVSRLKAEVYQDNLKAIRLYNKYGFKKCGYHDSLDMLEVIL